MQTTEQTRERTLSTEHPDRRLVVGLGSGRCGTHSLCELLSHQPDTQAFHQPPPCLPWAVDYGWYHDLREFIDDQAAATVAIVAWYYLPYAHLLMRDYDARFVCLKRDREATVDSIMRLTRGIDNWSNRGAALSATAEYRDLFPKYDVSDKREALQRYHDDYYRLAEETQRRFPGRVNVADLDMMNDRDGVADILRFAGYDDDALVLPGIREGRMDEYQWRDGPRRGRDQRVRPRDG